MFLLVGWQDYATEITLTNFGDAKKYAYQKALRDEATALWKSANPKKKRPHYQKVNRVCVQCRKTYPTSPCPVCGDKTVFTHYPVPKRRAKKKWAELKTFER